jgi:hypothetical protein
MVQYVGEEHALRPLTTAWCSKIKLAWDDKKKKFQDDADEAMRFFNGPYDWLYDTKGGKDRTAFAFVGDEVESPRLSFQMTVNKAAELVQIFGPALYHRNPVRQVNSRKNWAPSPDLYGNPQDPNIQMMHEQAMIQVVGSRVRDQARASLLEQYLNYTPTALDLKTESRFAVVEALLKGMGVLWTETYRPAGAQMQFVGSFFDTVDNLLIDPDAKSLRDAKWVARKCVAPYWQVEREYGLEQDSLKSAGSFESLDRQAVVSVDPKGEYNRATGRTNDLIVYWKIWSKMGAGARLSGARTDLRERLDPLGEYIYLVVSDCCGYPLNLPVEVSSGLMSDDVDENLPALQAAQQGLQWPTPFWADDAWPFTMFAFHPVPGSVWPMSHLRPGMGELKFLNWAYSMLAGKIKNACRDFIAIAKSASEELKENIRVGPDYTFIEVEAIHGDIDKIVKFLQHPGFNKDVYEVIERIAHNFERRTGLTELMYGMSSVQLRSAEEASVKSDQLNVRPDDMANKVEDAMTDAARKEAICARWHLEVQDVAPVVGDVGAMWWEQLLLNEPVEAVLHSLEYRIEAGSARKPNKSRDAANMQNAIQNLFQPLFGYAQATGDVGPVNALIQSWAKTIDLDATRFLLKPPPPPPPPDMMPNGPGVPPAPPGPPLSSVLPTIPPGAPRG